MVIDKEALELRLLELAIQRKDAFSTVCSIDGAIQDCKYWLSQLDKNDPDHLEEADSVELSSN